MTVVAERLRLVAAPDGREVAFAVWGDPAGFPVLKCTGRPAAGSCAGRTRTCTQASAREAVGSRAVGLLARWALTGTALARIEALVAPDNVASQRVLQKAGFLYE